MAKNPFQYSLGRGAPYKQYRLGPGTSRPKSYRAPKPKAYKPPRAKVYRAPKAKIAHAPRARAFHASRPAGVRRPAGIKVVGAGKRLSVPKARGASLASVRRTRTTFGTATRSLARGTSQSASQVRRSGLVWGGRRFTGAGQLGGWLKQHGSSYATFQQKHGKAASGLKGNKLPYKGRH